MCGSIALRSNRVGTRLPTIGGLIAIALIFTAVLVIATVQTVGWSRLRERGILAGAAVMAARGQHFGVVEFLLQWGADVNATDREERSILSWAVNADDPRLVRDLIRRGARVHISDSVGRTPLVWAAYRRAIPVMTELLAAKANVNPVGNFTPLQAAIESGHADSVRFLLSHGADPNAFRAGRTPLMTCAAFDRADLVPLLCANGADPGVSTDAGVTASSLARDASTAAALRDCRPR